MHSNLDLRRKKFRFAKILIAVCALVFGGLIYLGFRDERLLLFRWVNQVGLTDDVLLIRHFLSERNYVINSWVLYSVPNALWLLAGLLIFDAIWDQQKERQSAMFWIFGFSGLAISAEFLQFFGLLAGTYDVLDVSLMIAVLGAYLSALGIKRRVSTCEAPNQSIGFPWQHLGC